MKKIIRKITTLLKKQPAQPATSGNVIKNLVFEGGGIKGIAYVGALHVLKNEGLLQHVQQVSGASAGAITALLLGLSYGLDEMTQMLGMDLGKLFKDGAKDPLGKGLGVFNRYGMHPGKRFEKWCQKTIANRLGHPHATFADLHEAVLKQENTAYPFKFRDIHLIVANLSTKSQEVFSYEKTPKLPLWVALRVSMSLPIFFQPKIYLKDEQGVFVYDKKGLPIEDKKCGEMYVDGGLVNNYPITVFDHDHELSQTLGFKVDSPDEISKLKEGRRPISSVIKNFHDYGSALIYTAMAAQDKAIHHDHFRTVYIDVGNTGSTQFHLTEQEKKDLLQAGEVATRAYLFEFK